jgi:hypothetical protein
VAFTVAQSTAGEIMSIDMQTNSEGHRHFNNSRRRSFLYVWIAALIGIIFFVPSISTHIPGHLNVRISMNTFVMMTILQLVIAATIFAAIGAYLAPRIGFRAFLVNLPIKEKVFWMVLKRQFYYGASIGFCGAIIAYLIAPDFITYLNTYSFSSRLFGGINEEVITRWGLMTIIVWIMWRLFQHGNGSPKALLVYSGIILTQIPFAALKNFGIVNPIWSIVTIFIISLPWGWLFWKHGLESAFIAHSCFHAFVALFVAVKL